jgi:hypothetical protein
MKQTSLNINYNLGSAVKQRLYLIVSLSAKGVIRIKLKCATNSVTHSIIITKHNIHL